MGSLLIHALVFTSGLGALYASAVLLHRTLKWRTPVWWQSAAAVLFAVFALAGATKFCFDLLVHREFWRDPSTAIAILNFIGVMMSNSITLLPAGCAALYLLLNKRQNGGTNGAVEP